MFRWIHQTGRRSVRHADGGRTERLDGSVVVTMTPQSAVPGSELDEFVKARGGAFYRLDTGGDGILDPFKE